MNKKILYACLLITVAVLFRTVWHLGDNIEFVTAASLAAGSYLGLQFALLVPLGILAVSDLLLGNTNIFIFTWSAYLAIGVAGYLFNKRGTSLIKIIKGTSLGLTASLWFYLWTNFGVWLLDSWNMYPDTLYGLWQSYIFALPFLKASIAGNLLFCPLLFIAVETGKKLALKKSVNLRKMERTVIV